MPADHAGASPTETWEAFAPEPLAHMYVSDSGAALRTLFGAAHKHAISMFPSLKTGWPNPVEGVVESVLAEDSEVDPDIVDFQTQAFRLRDIEDGEVSDWICDHLRQYADGTVEAIEVKQSPDQLDPRYIRKLQRAARTLAKRGWSVRIVYEREIVGSPARRHNRSMLMQDRSVHVPEDALANFERPASRTRSVTFGELRETLDPRIVQGTAMARALVCRGRVGIDLNTLIQDSSPCQLRPTPRFTSRIRF